MVKSNDKKRARINAMRHVLGKFDYDNKDHEVVGRAGSPHRGTRPDRLTAARPARKEDGVRFVATLLLWLVTTVALAAAVPAMWAQQNVVERTGYAAFAQRRPRSGRCRRRWPPN